MTEQDKRQLITKVALDAGIAVRGKFYPALPKQSPPCLALESDASIVTMVIELMRVCPADRREDLASMLHRMETQQLGFGSQVYWRDIDSEVQ